MTGRKTIGWLAAAVVAIFALIASLLMAVTPATAADSSPCGATMPVQPMSGWTRDAKRVYKTDGTTKVQTVDYRVTPGTKIEMCVWNDFLPQTKYYGYIDNATKPEQYLGATPGYFFVDCPQDGRQHSWYLNVTPWDWFYYTGGYNQYIDWTYQGTMTCGTPSASQPPTTDQMQPPRDLHPGMNLAQARKVCAAKRPGKWVAKKKRGKSLRIAKKRNLPLYKCVKRKKPRPSITS